MVPAYATGTTFPQERSERTDRRRILAVVAALDAALTLTGLAVRLFKDAVRVSVRTGVGHEEHVALRVTTAAVGAGKGLQIVGTIREGDHRYRQRGSEHEAAGRHNRQIAGLRGKNADRSSYPLSGGNDWQPLQTNLPIVPITDLMIRRNDLVLATQGRAFWVFDDISALRQFDTEHERADVHLYAPMPAYRMTPTQAGYGGGESTAPSAPHGAVLYYSLAAEADFEAEDAPKLKIEISSSNGEIIRTLKTHPKVGIEGGSGPDGYALPAEKGLNRAVWDFTTERTAKIDYGVVFGAGPRDKSIGGYHVAPGTYTVRPEAWATRSRSRPSRFFGIRSTPTTMQRSPSSRPSSRRPSA